MKCEIRKIVKVGNSLLVSIPCDFARKLKLREGDYVIIYQDKDEIHILPL